MVEDIAVGGVGDATHDCAPRAVFNVVPPTERALRVVVIAEKLEEVVVRRRVSVGEVRVDAVFEGSARDFCRLVRHEELRALLDE